MLLAGCANMSLEELKEKPHGGSEYSQALADQYQNFANREYNSFNDLYSTSLFSKKGKAAAHGHGETLGIEDPEVWLIQEPMLTQMRQDRNRLLTVLTCGQQRAPKETAAAVRYYEEWLEQVAEGWQKDDIAKAHELFLLNLQIVETRCAAKQTVTKVSTKFVPSSKDVTHVYFKLDKFNLDANAINTLANFKKNLDPNTYITIKGYTDASGTTKHNEVLSQRRANAVSKYLLHEREVSHKDVIGKGVVPNSPKYEKNNRRVDVIIVHPAETEQTVESLKTAER